MVNKKSVAADFYGFDFLLRESLRSTNQILSTNISP